MKTLVFLLEEPSAGEMLKGLVPRLIPHEQFSIRFIPFEGKQDLEKQLKIKIRGWKTPNTRFVILRDQDACDCKEVKQNLFYLCQEANRSDTLIRIACTELESWYLGDLSAVERAFEIKNLATKQQKSKYRNPDKIKNPVHEIEQLTNAQYQKINGSRRIGPLLNIQNNCSPSFNTFISGIKK